MALQPSSQSDSLARTGDHRPADPASRLLSSSALLEIFGLERNIADRALWVCWTERAREREKEKEKEKERCLDVWRDLRCDYTGLMTC